MKYLFLEINVKKNVKRKKSMKFFFGINIKIDEISFFFFFYRFIRSLYKQICICHLTIRVLLSGQPYGYDLIYKGFGSVSLSQKIFLRFLDFTNY
jgi:hypothetical protein